MTAREVLDRIVAREAGKLDKLSEASPNAPLDNQQLEALEMLARCSKALNVAPSKNDDDMKPGTVDVAADLELAAS
jgi:hypothetical protein